MERRVRHLTRDQCVEITTLHTEGHGYRELGRRYGVAHTTVARVVQRYQETHTHDRRPGQGRPRATTPSEDRFIRLRALRERHTTARHLQIQLAEVHGTRVSDNTVRRRLAEHNCRPRRPAVGPPLTREHRRARLAFARQHIRWTDDDWATVLFTDESRVALYSSDMRGRVYRRPNERFAQVNMREVVPFGGGSVMVWGGISLSGPTELHILDGGTLTAARYITDILEPYVVPYAPFIGPSFLLMHDNARPHTAQCVTTYLRAVGITTLQWPSYSPDLNPIEHLWDVMKRRLRQLQPPPTSIPSLRQALHTIWDQFTVHDIQPLIGSMPQRCQAVIRARGGHTRY